jgi:hypothetical protein
MTGYAHFYTRCIRKIHNVVYKTIGLGPIWFTAGTCVKMAFFRTHDATITGGQASEARVAEPLAETFIRLAITVDTVDLPAKLQ